MASTKRPRVTTGIGRRIDLRYRSNRYALVASGLAALATLFWRLSTNSDEAWFWAWRVLVGAFVAWAITRELDPDEPASAVAAPLLLLPFLLLGPPAIAASAAVLVASRITVRSTGLSPSWFDGLVLVGGSVYLGSQPESWPAAGALVLAVYLDNVLYPSGPTRSLYTAVLMTVAAVGAALAWAGPGSWENPTFGEWIGAGAVLIGLLAAVLMVRPPTSRGDFRKIQLAEGRVLAVRLLPGAVLVGGLIYPGGPIIPALSPLWAGIIAIPAAAWVRRRILKPM